MQDRQQCRMLATLQHSVTSRTRAGAADPRMTSQILLHELTVQGAGMRMLCSVLSRLQHTHSPTLL